MRKSIIFILLLFIVSFIFTGTSIAETKSETELLPDITLTIPENTAHVQYLGLKGEPGTPFKISDIDADILMIELFSMYCPYCQKAAPNIN
jgi:protein-disulfide isomerase